MRSFAIFLSLAFGATLSARPVADEPLSARVTGYEISVTLNTTDHTISGDMKTWWVNRSGSPVSTAMMHMYLNAFSSTGTTFNKSRSWLPDGDDGWGWIRINNMTDRRGNSLNDRLSFVSPDDSNSFDRSVLLIELPQAVNPGDTLYLNIDFTSKLPSPIVRTGFKKDFYFAGQWFPKFGVYETAGMMQRLSDGWNCHQFHPHSEFYSNHSLYDVTVRMPLDYIAGSGGYLVDETDNGDGTKLVHWKAEDIVDFAWTAWPGYKVVKANWRGVNITLLTTKEGLKIASNQISALTMALEYLDRHVGLYPWTYLTFIDPPVIGSGSGGMEYTTLFTSSGGGLIPTFIKLPEMVTIHEFGHAYFMGMLASNEFEEPWLDEGVNSYWEQRMVDDFYGEGYGMVHLPFLKLSDTDMGRTSYIMHQSRQAATNDMTSWEYPHGTYSMMSYNKTATWLHTLEGLIGTDAIDEVFREYYKRWAFRHPSGHDFTEVVNEVVKSQPGTRFSQGMDWYFDQVIRGTDICDYRISELSNNKVRGFSGITDIDSLTMVKADRENDTLNIVKVSLERLGGIKVPVELLVRFDDGREIREEWDGTGRYKDFVYTGTARVVSAEIDPDEKILIDVNRFNNSRILDQSYVPVRRMKNKYIFLMELIISALML